ncbi:MAG: peroxiredoxin [Endozoicomonadaceae bacterium]|nr:peroxiredoxin [Endozoicomonadaceae bacterium]
MEAIIEGSLTVGDYLPDITIFEYNPATLLNDKKCIKKWQLSDLAYKKKIVVIGVTGAFTPVCHNQHLPEFIKYHRQFLQKGVDELWCISPNDPFVMKAWSESLKVKNKIRMLSDEAAELATALNTTIDLSARGMGLRSDRFVIIAENGQIVNFVTEMPGQCTCTDAKAILALIGCNE